MRGFLIRTFLPSPGVCAAVVAFFATLTKPDNADTLWHLAIGRWILAHRALPDINSLYYSATSGHGYDYSWLSQIVLFGVYQLLGGTGLAVLNSIAAGFIFYFLYRLLERNSRNMLVNFAVLGFAFVLTSSYLACRPVIFTVALFSLVVFILSDFVRSRRNLIWLIPPGVAIWVNLHPGFILAPLAILLFLLLAPEAQQRRSLTVCLIAACAAVILNPYLWRMYLMPLEMARALPMLRGLSEWRETSGSMIIVWGVLVALVAYGFAVRRQSVPIVVMVALFALAAGLSYRNLPLFAVVAVFAIGEALPALSPVIEKKRLLRRFNAGYDGTGGWFWVIVIPVVMIGMASLRSSPVDLEFDFAQYPMAAVRQIKHEASPGNIFVRETWSGYLLWEMPDRKLFFDAKGGFSRQATKEHSELVKPGPKWRDVADRYNISTFLLERESPLAITLDEASDWQQTYSDSLSTLFVHRGNDSGATNGTLKKPKVIRWR